MSTNIWVSTTGDWSNTAGWHNSDVPDSADSALLVDNGGVAVTAGLSQSAIDLAQLMIIDFPYDVGSSAAPLVIGATTFQILGNTGNVHITNHSGSTNTWYINSQNRTAAANLNGSAYTRVVVVRGVVTITSSSISLLQVGYDKNQNRDAVVNLVNCSVLELQQSGGTINASGTAIAAHHKSGGTFNYTGAPSGVYGTIWHGSGKYDYRGTSDGGPNIEVIVASGGTMNFANVLGPTSIDSVIALPGAKYVKNSQLVTVTSELLIENELAYGPQP